MRDHGCFGGNLKTDSDDFFRTLSLQESSAWMTQRGVPVLGDGVGVAGWR